jgi:Fe-S-cluster containining protein
MMGRVEWQRICKRVGHEPRATSLTCPLLQNARCSVYLIRPMICRLWGLVETMPCLWGCVPERYLTREEGFEFLARAARLQPEAAAGVITRQST